MAHSELTTIAVSLNLQHIIIIFLSIYHLGTFFHHLKFFILVKELLGEGPFVAAAQNWGSGSVSSLCQRFPLSALITDITSLLQNLCNV